MPHIQITGKRLQINKANSTMVIVVAVASFVVTFCAVASKTLLSQRSYQARVIAKKEQARDTLKQNVENVDLLAVAYKEFVETPDNVLGGDPKGEGDRDGDNAQITLNALPSKYDFPALTTSIEKLVASKNFTLEGITGVDDEVSQAANADSGGTDPVEVPFEVSVRVGSYNGVRDLLQLFQRSIRPFKVQQLTISGEDGSIVVTASVVTYYQPARTLDIKKEVVR